MNASWLTTDDVAAEIRMSREWVAEECRCGRLTAKKLGKEWRIHRDALDVYMGTPPARGPQYPEHVKTARQRRRWAG